MKELFNKLYYKVKPLIPRRIQLYLRRKYILFKYKSYEKIWPIDYTSSKPPHDWGGWPDKKEFAFILTHDVDTAKGQEKCLQLMKIEQLLGFRSSFNFVPERYDVSSELRENLLAEGFEVGVHGLNHDGKLYQSKTIFEERVKKINHYINEWKAAGFRSPAMHHNLEWIHELDIKYDASTFDTDPFEPQSDGVKTIFPFFVKNHTGKGGYVELPYTLPQDFTLLILMKKNTDIWKQKIEWIAEHGGMVLLNTHPDYMNFGDTRTDIEEYPTYFYEDFLNFVKSKYEGKYWHVLPREVAQFITQ
jgi:hypothetical protein